MINQILVIFILVVYFVMANLPWVSDKIFFIKTTVNKSNALRWFEWLVMYGLSMLFGVLVERKIMGTISAQDWEFYVVTVCLFVVFALPGFIYCYDLKKILKMARPKVK